MMYLNLELFVWTLARQNEVKTLQEACNQGFYLLLRFSFYLPFSAIFQLYRGGQFNNKSRAKGSCELFHHLSSGVYRPSSIVCRPSSINFSHSNLLLKNHCLKEVTTWAGFTVLCISNYYLQRSRCTTTNIREVF
jgi:hypothetical protein